MILRCSAESLYGRFLTVVHPDTAASRMVDALESEPATWWLAEVDRTVVGVGATHRFDRASTEISILVEDGWQRRGIATGLLPDLVEDARARRTPHLWATALGERVPIIRKLLEGVGASLEVSISAGIAEMTAELPALPALRVREAS
jgi:GNAT superfamily N-acetyltransferase